MKELFIKKRDARGCKKCDLSLGGQYCLLIYLEKHTETCIYPTVFKFWPKHLLKKRRF